MTYAYNNVGVRTSAEEAAGGEMAWTYDETYQLTGEERSGPSVIDWATFTLAEWENFTLGQWSAFELNPRSGNYSINYEYDGAGNRTLSDDDGAPTTYVYDGANQLQTSQNAEGTTTYTYDAAGNLQLVQAPGDVRTTYAWSVDNRQTKIELPGSAVVTNSYRADGLRREKQDSGGTTRFVYDGQAYLAETDGSNVTQAVYTHEPEPYCQLISQRRQE